MALLGLTKGIRCGRVLHSSLRHENLVRVYGWYERQSTFYLVMEHLARGHLSEKVATQ